MHKLLLNCKNIHISKLEIVNMGKLGNNSTSFIHSVYDSSYNTVLECCVTTHLTLIGMGFQEVIWFDGGRRVSIHSK